MTKPSHAAPKLGTSADFTLVVDELLHDGGVVVFRGLGADGTSVRSVVPRALIRTPVPGETWRVEGAWERHPQYGRQIGQVRSATLVRPTGRLFVQAVARDTERFPGIGPMRAQRVWDAHGERIFDLLDSGDEGALTPLIREDLAAVLIAGWRDLDTLAVAYRWLTHHGVAPAVVAKAVAIYGALPVPPEHELEARRIGPVVWHLQDDPYRLLAFTSWRDADAAARQLGMATEDSRRLVGAAEAACASRLCEGDTWIPHLALRAGTARLLGLGVAAADRGITLAVERGVLVAHAGGYQLPGTHCMERFVQDRCADDLYRFKPKQRLTSEISRERVASLLSEYEHLEGYSLQPEQRAAVWMAMTERVSLLLGGPGVGKTTVLKAVHHVAEAYGGTVHQAALSGRAKLRMEETTGRPARTIASLLLHVERGDIVLDDDPLVVIDEASMCDLATIYRLLRRFPPGVRMLFVGDPGQLAPIGFGTVFHVLAAGTLVPRTTLTKVQRQTSASGIPAVCAAIRSGVMPAFAPNDWSLAEGVGFIDVTPHEVTEAVMDVLTRLGGTSAVQVVGSVKPRLGGVDEINRRLHALHGAGRGQLNGRFYAGEPVIATHNDYDLAVMNGELGIALRNADDGGGLVCRFDSGDKEVPQPYLDDHLELAYAITCHKAQGSQFPKVVIPVTSSRLLDRSLLLTAVSRAQHRVVLVGDRDVFERAIAEPSKSDQRLVGLGRSASDNPA